MNADLYTVLLMLSFVGVFLAVVVGRLQFSGDDDLQREVAEKLRAAKSLEEDYQTQADLAESLGATGRSDFLPIIGHHGGGSHEDLAALSPGRLLRRALGIYEAIEHVDDPDSSDSTYKVTVSELGLDGPSELQHTDLKSMLRLARLCIHSRAHGHSLEQFRQGIKTLIDEDKLSLSDGGKLRLREVLTLLHRDDMQALTEEYRDFIPVIEELLLNDPVKSG